MPAPHLRTLLAVIAASTLLLAGCRDDDGQGAVAAQPSASPRAEGTLGKGFFDPEHPPGPEETITPSPGSWAHVRPVAGYQVALVIDGVRSDLSPTTDVLHDAVHDWADSHQVALTEIVAPDAQHYVSSLQQAIDATPDLVIVVGNGLVDPLAMVSAPNLETEFLIVGAEIAEPTQNVTAADWQGAMFRGEGLGLPESFDPKTFTPQRAADAVSAGTAAVLSRLTGIVVWIS